MKSKLETEPNVILDKLRVTRIHIDIPINNTYKL